MSKRFYLVQDAIPNGVRIRGQGDPISSATHIKLKGLRGSYKLGLDVFEVLADAVAAAELQREQRIAWHERKIQRLRNFKIEVKDMT